MKLKNGNNIKVVVWDTSGQERFSSAAIRCIQTVHGVIINFSVKEEGNFQKACKWFEDAKEFSDEKIYYLFRNQADIPKEEWKIKTEEIMSFAKKNKLPYFETSAKNNTGIEEGNSFIANDIYEKLENIKNIINNYIILNKSEKGSNSDCIGKKKNKTNTKIKK